MGVSGRAPVSRSRRVAIRAASTWAAPLLLVVLLSAGLASCSRIPDRRQEQLRAAEQQRLKREAQCRSDRQRLLPLVEAVQRSQDRVAAIEAQAYGPTAPPAPLDPQEQRRLAIYDQEIEQEQYDQAYAAWQAQEADRRALWSSERRERLRQAREQRAAAVAALQAQAPALLRATTPPELNQPELQRRLSCGAAPR